MAHASTVPSAVVVEAGPPAHLVRLVAAGNDLYVIDNGAEHVRRYVLNGLPYAELFTQVMRWQEGADKVIMGKPLDLFLRNGRLLILDSLGSLWSYDGPTYRRAMVPLRLQSNQGNPVAVALHGQDLLLLDPNRRQIWRYRPAPGGGYDSIPQALWPGAQASLAGATRLAVGRQGLAVLAAHDSLLMVSWAQPRHPVSLRFPEQVTGVWAAQQDADYVISFAHSIAVITMSGRVLWQARPDKLGTESIAGVAVSPSGRLYVLTATRILRLDRAGQPRL